LFALCLAGLAASDARMGIASLFAVQRIEWRPYYSRAMAGFMVGCLTVAAYITQLAAECEQKIVHATRIALSISASGNPTHPRWNAKKAEMLKLLREGIDINPHYRKITPINADELAKWGDWKNATWIWESVLSSRPYVVAMLTNASRGYITMGNGARAMELLERAKKIQPHAAAVRSLEVILLSRTGQEARALELGRKAIAEKVYDFDLANITFYLAWKAGDFDLAARAIQMRMEAWPHTRVSGLIQLGNMYATPLKDPERALESFRQAMAGVPEGQRESLLPQIPKEFWPKLGFPNSAAPPSPAPHTSASKG
jgi:O-antigen ligase